MTTSFRGYLNDDYMSQQYMSDEGYEAIGMQVARQIVDYKKPVGQQVARHINDYTKPVGQQVSRTIADFKKPLGQQVARHINDFTKPLGQQINRTIADATKPVGQQVARTIADHQKPLGQQVSRTITDFTKPVGQQVSRQVVDHEAAVGMQVDRAVVSEKPMGQQVLRVTNISSDSGLQVARFVVSTASKGMNVRLDRTFSHWLAPELGYLETPYLEDPYLVEGFFVQGPMQVQRNIVDHQGPIGQQVDRTITTNKAMGQQVQRIVTADQPMGMQVAFLRSAVIGMQVSKVLYNTNNLRVMLDFPSRGVSGLNWTSTSTASGDFSPNNLNTDIVEQVWRSVDGITSVSLTSDTEVVQGVAIDTYAMLNHNLTTSASITVEGSLDDFATVNQSFAVTPDKTNAYYIAPTFPNLQSSKWRTIISDPTNPEGRLQIGTIVFGTTIILQGECFVDDVDRSTKHFADRIPTEAFTNVSNDRAIKRLVGLTFRNIQYNRGNYKNLRNLFDTARTSLKCLWIPDPQQTDRFSLFGKLTQIPPEKHKNMGAAADLVNFPVEIDESL